MKRAQRSYATQNNIVDKTNAGEIYKKKEGEREKERKSMVRETRASADVL
jgi:hypothetical protein